MGATITGSCLGKTRYESVEEAEFAAKELAKQYDRQLRAYHCGLCDGAHLASKNKAR